MVLNSASGIYYARKFKSGRGNFFQTTGLRKKARAQSKVDEMIAAWLSDKGDKVDASATVSEVADRLLLQLEQEYRNGDRAKETWMHDQYLIPIVKQYFGTELVSAIDET